MAWGKTAEQKQPEPSEEQMSLQNEAGAAEQALDAHRNGDGFFQIQLPVSELEVMDSFIVKQTNVLRPVTGAGGVLGRIEQIGWRLEHVGYVFVQTGSLGRDGVSSSTATKGQVAGIYLFRRAEA